MAPSFHQPVADPCGKRLLIEVHAVSACCKCKGKIRELDKYRAEEARLDLKLAKKYIKERIRAKKELLRN